VDTGLIVDDDKDLLEIVGDVLQKSGYEVLTAGWQCRSCILQERGAPNLVITDRQMPGMDGLTLIRRLRENMSALPLVMRTGHGDLESNLSATNLDVVRYIVKPLELRELKRIVRDTVAEGLCARTFKELEKKPDLTSARHRLEQSPEP
jgi:DNA-binding response OmpR family regulator